MQGNIQYTVDDGKNLLKNKGFFAIITEMAGLLKRRRVVKILDNYYSAGASSPEVEQKRTADQDSGGVPEQEFIDDIKIHHIGMWNYLKYCFFSTFNRKKAKGVLSERRDKVLKIYRECLNHRYIKRIDEDKNILRIDDAPLRGIVRVTTADEHGKDLTHWAGFLEAYLQEYPLTWKSAIQFIGVIGGTGGVIGGIALILLKLGVVIINVIFHTNI